MDISYKVWIEVEAYDEETGEGEDVDLGWASSAQFATEQEAVGFATELHRFSQAAQASVPPVLTEEDEREAGLYLAEVLGLKLLTIRTADNLNDAGRYTTSVGTKTPLGLYRLIESIVLDVRLGKGVPAC